MTSPVLLLILLVVFFFSFYGKKTILGFWGSFFLLMFVSLLLFPVMNWSSFLPGAAFILLLGRRK